MLDEKVKPFMRLLLATFDEHCNPDLYMLKYQLREYMVEDL